MTLVLETGAGVPGANSYCSLDYANAYHGDRGRAAWGEQSAAEREQRLVLATGYLDTLVDWHGTKADDDFPLEWPRHGVTDRNGYGYDSDEIPEWLRRATAEFALFLATNDDPTAPSDKFGVRRVRADSVEIEFDAAMASSTPMLPRLVARMVAPYGSVVSREVSRRLGRS